MGYRSASRPPLGLREKRQSRQVDSKAFQNPGRGNGAYIRPSFRSRLFVRRTLRLGRSEILWRGPLSRWYLFFLRLTARGSRRPGRSGTKSAARVRSNSDQISWRFFLERALAMAWLNSAKASREPLKLMRSKETRCSVAARAIV